MIVTADEVNRSFKGTIDLLHSRSEGLKFFDMSGALLDNLWLDAVVALGHVGGYIALPLAMIFIARSLRLTGRYVPFVIVTNWISVIALLVLSIPAMLLLLGWATPSLASLFSLAFVVILVRMQWFATKATLGLSTLPALGIVLFGILLNAGVGSLTRGLLS
jgi:hypothetical protein